MDSQTNDYSYKEQNRTGKIIKTVFKTLLVALIIFIYGFFMLRLCTSKPKNRIIWTDETLAAKQAEGENFKVYTQSPHVFIDDGGYQFSIFNIYYIPSAKQLQVTVRYNLSVLDVLKEEYSLSDNTENEPFIYTLLFDDGTRIKGYRYSAYTTSRYYFKYLIFDGVELDSHTLVSYTPQDAAVTDSDGNIIAHETDENGGSILYETNEDGMAIVYTNNNISLDTYYIEDVDFNKLPLSSLILFDRNLGWKEVNYNKYLPGDDELPLITSPKYDDKTE